MSIEKVITLINSSKKNISITKTFIVETKSNGDLFSNHPKWRSGEMETQKSSIYYSISSSLEELKSIFISNAANIWALCTRINTRTPKYIFCSLQLFTVYQLKW